MHSHWRTPLSPIWFFVSLQFSWKPCLHFLLLWLRAEAEAIAAAAGLGPDTLRYSLLRVFIDFALIATRRWNDGVSYKRLCINQREKLDMEIEEFSKNSERKTKQTFPATAEMSGSEVDEWMNRTVWVCLLMFSWLFCNTPAPLQIEALWNFPLAIWPPSACTCLPALTGQRKVRTIML